MRRVGRLWDEIVSFDNLWLASRRARRGKRERADVARFEDDVEGELLRLEDELVSGSYRPGAYRDFIIFEPKRRIISAAPYRDRVVHHAVCQVVAPVLERSFISDSYAHRVGFGTHRALRRFTRLLRGHRYVLQCDVVGFYPNLVHDVLKRQLRRRLKCRDTLQLLDTIIDGPGDSTGKGLPIGNLTSQLFGNCTSIPWTTS